ncbi:PREDICTED: hematopoietic progenitor cell antigen CD34 isoform X1 [Bison bison bison]|uniref:Hematopoietic progenitor cell antigen CD34 isoform X1 n=1 Tax=Bison bison bison TaxID=43346 RepID=A0A6P3H7P9_BISBB|nr:PREDICTED: hematopoietic progenitor cell antigen CD34 isoform X1 [Bison bison bison]
MVGSESKRLPSRLLGRERWRPRTTGTRGARTGPSSNGSEAHLGRGPGPRSRGQGASMEFTQTPIATTATVSASPEISSPVPTTTSDWRSMNSSTFRSTSLYNVSQDSNGTTAVTLVPASTDSFTSTSETLPASGAVNSSVQSQTSLATTVSSTLISFATSEATLQPSTFPGNISDSLYNSTSPVTFSIITSPSFSPTQSILKSEIKCSRVKEVKLAHSICLKLNETSSCEEFKKNNEEKLTRFLCQEEQVEVCSLLLAQSEVRPQCLLLVLTNRTESSSKIKLLQRHWSELREMGIQEISEEAVSSHQSYSRKTLIALVTSGILLAILITTCYFLMNRRSWSPTGERLGEDPYYVENGGGQGYSSGPEASPEAQGKAIVNRGAQENGTGQATSRNGHSARQRVVADTEL